MGAALVVSMFGAAGASASFHLMKIREVSSGTGTANSSYVEIQMDAPGQNFLSNGATLLRCDATCSSPTAFMPFANVASGANQSTVVFGDDGLPSGSKDFTISNLNLDTIEAGGAICYLSEPGFNDCVSWGDFSSNSTLVTNYGTSAGTPAPALSSGMALRRTIAQGCPTALEASDDTDNSLVDFPSLVTPNPRPNSSPILETPCGSGPAGYPTPAPRSPSTKKKCKKHKRSARTAKKCKKRK